MEWVTNKFMTYLLYLTFTKEMQQVKWSQIQTHGNDQSYQYSPSLSPHLLFSLSCQTNPQQHQQILTQSMPSPAKWIYANVLVCRFLSISPPRVQQSPNHSFLTISHFCALSLSNLHLALPLSVWMVARPARQLSHGVESQHLVAGSDQSSPLETHQYPSSRIHTHAPLPPNSGGTVGSESEGEIESGREKWIGLLNGSCSAF